MAFKNGHYDFSTAIFLIPHLCQVGFAKLLIELYLVECVSWNKLPWYAATVRTQKWCARRSLSTTSLKHRLPKWAFYKTCAHIRRGSCCRQILERPTDVCSW